MTSILEDSPGTGLRVVLRLPALVFAACSHKLVDDLGGKGFGHLIADPRRDPTYTVQSQQVVVFCSPFGSV